MGASSSEITGRSSRHFEKRREVAAVCYRTRKGSVEFLLVQTRNGRWTFPKGGVEGGLTQAQSAALEAVEEAGVHGRMEEIPFARYFRSRPAGATTAKRERSAAPLVQPKLAVVAHLCEVTRQEAPQEPNRNPAWFIAEKAKQRLRKGRAPEFGAELARVVDRACLRIQRLHDAHSTSDWTSNRAPKDALQKVQFEAFEDARFHNLSEAAFARSFSHLRKLKPMGGNVEIRPILRLGSGASSGSETVHNITAIDGRRNSAKKRAQ